VVTRRSPDDRLRGVFFHDPDALKPKNLNDPFHDNEVQERIAVVIARATRPSEPEKPNPN
jgi:hypothetical protein